MFLVYFGSDFFHNSLNICYHLLVCKSEHFESFLLQILSPFLVTYLLCGVLMISSVQFNYKLFLKASEVSNEITNDILSPEGVIQSITF